MIVLLGILAGAGWGYISAQRKGGNTKDKAQYAAVGGIIGGLVGLFVTIGIEKMF